MSEPLTPYQRATMAHDRIKQNSVELYYSLSWIVEFVAEHEEWWNDGVKDSAENEWLSTAQNLLSKIEAR